MTYIVNPLVVLIITSGIRSSTLIRVSWDMSWFVTDAGRLGSNSSASLVAVWSDFHLWLCHLSQLIWFLSVTDRNVPWTNALTAALYKIYPMFNFLVMKKWNRVNVNHCFFFKSATEIFSAQGHGLFRLRWESSRRLLSLVPSLQRLVTTIDGTRVFIRLVLIVYFLIL
jgi:hypothetical protein